MFHTKVIRVALAFLLLMSTATQAQLFRAYLASDGSDANPCTLQAPCRLLPAALNAVADGGEVWMLDSANYNTGTVNITKSVSILAVPGVVGSLVATGGPAIDISGVFKVSLRNLVIAPVATLLPGTVGVNIFGGVGTIVTIENSLIANLPASGIAMTGGESLQVVNTTIRNAGGYGVALVAGARATLKGVQLLSNSLGGVYVRSPTPSTTTASISDSLVSGGAAGVFAYAEYAGTVARISVANSTIKSTTTALRSETNGNGSAEVNFGSSLIVDNNNAWLQNGAGSSVLSLGNNQMSGNTASVGSKTPLAPQ